MVNLGSISFITETGGSFDANHNPVPSEKVNSEYVECNIKVITREYKTMVDGMYKQARYSIIVDWVKISSFELTTLKEIQLKDNKGVNLGVFQVQSQQYLTTTGQLKLVV